MRTKITSIDLSYSSGGELSSFNVLNNPNDTNSNVYAHIPGGYAKLPSASNIIGLFYQTYNDPIGIKCRKELEGASPKVYYKPVRGQSNPATKVIDPTTLQEESVKFLPAHIISQIPNNQKLLTLPPGYKIQSYQFSTPAPAQGYGLGYFCNIGKADGLQFSSEGFNQSVIANESFLPLLRFNDISDYSMYPENMQAIRDILWQRQLDKNESIKMPLGINEHNILDNITFNMTSGGYEKYSKSLKQILTNNIEEELKVLSHFAIYAHRTRCTSTNEINISIYLQYKKRDKIAFYQLSSQDDPYNHKKPVASFVATQRKLTTHSSTTLINSDQRILATSISVFFQSTKFADYLNRTRADSDTSPDWLNKLKIIHSDSTLIEIFRVAFEDLLLNQPRYFTYLKLHDFINCCPVFLSNIIEALTTETIFLQENNTFYSLIDTHEKARFIFAKLIQSISKTNNPLTGILHGKYRFKKQLSINTTQSLLQLYAGGETLQQCLTRLMPTSSILSPSNLRYGYPQPVQPQLEPQQSTPCNLTPSNLRIPHPQPVPPQQQLSPAPPLMNIIIPTEKQQKLELLNSLFKTINSCFLYGNNSPLTTLYSRLQQIHQSNPTELSRFSTQTIQPTSYHNLLSFILYQIRFLENTYNEHRSSQHEYAYDILKRTAILLFSSFSSSKRISTITKYFYQPALKSGYPEKFLPDSHVLTQLIHDAMFIYHMPQLNQLETVRSSKMNAELSSLKTIKTSNSNPNLRAISGHIQVLNSQLKTWHIDNMNTLRHYVTSYDNPDVYNNLLSACAITKEDGLHYLLERGMTRPDTLYLDTLCQTLKKYHSLDHNHSSSESAPSYWDRYMLHNSQTNHDLLSTIFFKLKPLASKKQHQLTAIESNKKNILCELIIIIFQHIFDDEFIPQLFFPTLEGGYPESFRPPDNLLIKLASTALYSNPKVEACFNHASTPDWQSMYSAPLSDYIKTKSDTFFHSLATTIAHDLSKISKKRTCQSTALFSSPKKKMKPTVVLPGFTAHQTRNGDTYYTKSP